MKTNKKNKNENFFIGKNGRQYVDLTDRVFGDLVVLGQKKERTTPNILWECKCSCGRTCYLSSVKLLSRGQKTCGCSQRVYSDLPWKQSPYKAVYRAYVRGARERGLNFELTEIELYQLTQKCCSYCGVEPIKKYSTSTKRFFQGNGIDRINNFMGYTKENCTSCCKICNKAKSNLSLQEFNNWISRLITFNSNFN